MRIRSSIIAEIVQDHCQRAAETGDVRHLVAFWRDRAMRAVRERDVDTGRDVVEAIREITDELRVRKEVLRADLVETSLVIGGLEEVRRRLVNALVETGGIDDEIQARRGITAGPSQRREGEEHGEGTHVLADTGTIGAAEVGAAPRVYVSEHRPADLLGASAWADD